MANTVERSLPWKDGTYKATGCLYNSINICGNTGQATGTELSLQHGEFGTAAHKIAEHTGQEFYNVEIKYNFGGELVEFGVISDDGLKITLKTIMGNYIGILEWMTEEEAADFEAAKDPMEAPPHP